jgi:hypothetical protein
VTSAVLAEERIAVADRRSQPFVLIDHAVLALLPVIGMTAFALYAGLCKFANVDRQAWPSLTTLATLVGAHRETVVEGLAVLEREGLIAIERRDGRRSNRYTLLPVVGKSDQSEKTTSRKIRPMQSENPTTTSRKIRPELEPRELEPLIQIHSESVHPSTKTEEAETLRGGSTRTGTQARARARTTTIPADLMLTPAMRIAIAAVGCRDPDAAFRRFVDKHTALQKRYFDWEGAVWRTWVGNHGRYGCPCGAATQAPGGTPRPASRAFPRADVQRARQA